MIPALGDASKETLQLQLCQGLKSRRNQITLIPDSMNSLRCPTNPAAKHTVMPDDHSKLAPLLPIPNRTVKRLRADDSAGSRGKVGHRQALMLKRPAHAGRFLLSLQIEG